MNNSFTPFKNLLNNYSLRSKKGTVQTEGSIDSIQVQADVHLTPQSNPVKSRTLVAQRLFNSEQKGRLSQTKMADAKGKLKLSNLMSMITPLKPKTKGYELFSANCERVLKLADANGVDKEALISQIINYIGESGCDFTVSHELKTWAEIKKICDENFFKRLSEPQILLKLTSLKQGKDHVFKYYNKFARLIKQYGDVVKEQYEQPEQWENLELAISQINKIAMGAFVSGLETDIKKSLVHEEPKTLKEAYDLARKYEDRMIDYDEDDEDETVQKTLQKILKIVDEPKFSKPQINRTEAVVCQLCNGDHSAKNCPSESRGTKPSVVCQICDKPNHTAQRCFQRNQSNFRNRPSNYRNNGPNSNNRNYNNNFNGQNPNGNYNNGGPPAFNNNNYPQNRNAQPGPSRP